MTSDYTIDAEDIAELMAGGAHLVGHSYGGTVAMLAAAANTNLVRSLTFIEPCAHTVASDDAAVARAIEDGRQFMADARRGTPEEYIDLAYGDRPRPEPAAWLLRAAQTALHERSCWLADLATEPLSAADFPKLVIVGGWETAPPGYRPGHGEPDAKDQSDGRRPHQRSARTGARRRARATTEQPQAVNALLAELWSTA